MAARLASLPVLFIGSLFFLAAGVFVTLYLPSLDQAAYTPTQYARQYTEEEARGRGIYIREGCWYCHTQQVRPPEVGIGTVRVKGDIGAVSQPGDYVYQKPVLWGTTRQGPDLAHAASRVDEKGFAYGANPAWQYAHLQNPQALNPGSVMPSFAHLPSDELGALVAYLLTLK